ncbi:anthocyanidin 3-O-glucosyltransferase 2-like [Argentina anserina]|uniref:anthocyanidin 3-O-glucosyltransferase 2-like n=1 Tax=Argentina anserina TaxID=57926 RepID=UPI0021763678|nr:anthocyanidin 3-O-glucosyltransferase 2-like [Potentilla anserina]
MERAELVFVPTPAVGHLVSTIEFAFRLLDQSHRFSVTILVMKSPFGVTGDQSLPAASHPHIKLIYLPNVDPPTERVSAEKYLTDYIENYKGHVRDTIFTRVLPNTSQVAGMVIDMFCTTMIDIGNELKVPSFLFFTSGAAYLGLLMYLPKRADVLFDESDCESIIPSYIQPVPTSALPAFAFNKGGYMSFVNHARRFRETKGIIINSSVELESHAVSSLFDGDEDEQSKSQPHVYTIGPLIDIKGKYQIQFNQTKVDGIMKWLDDQSPKSVVFLCFGSSGSFDENQLKEIAIGLEQSGQRFLWSVRQRPTTGRLGIPGEYTSYDEFLPQDFSKRTKDIGMLCGWAPQAEVLGHKAIGGFVSHCGWNSILESLWFGVPIVTWPIYAEQQINAFQMARDMGLGVELRVVYNKDGDFVTADEIEKALRRLMEGDNEIRKRVQEMSRKCRNAVDDGGSSSASFRSLIQAMLANLNST